MGHAQQRGSGRRSEHAGRHEHVAQRRARPRTAAGAAFWAENGTQTLQMVLT